MISIKKQIKIDELNLDGYKHIKNNDWGLPQNLIDWLTEHGFEQIGRGLFSLVFQSEEEDFVVKVNKGRIDKGYLQFVEFCQENKGNPHLPKMGQIKKYEDWYIIFIEKLKPVENNLNDGIKLNSIIKRIIFSETLEDEDVNDKNMFSKIANRVIHNTVLPSMFENDNNKKQLIEIAFLLFKFRIKFNISHRKFDVHFGNIMMRGDTIVITDPVT